MTRNEIKTKVIETVKEQLRMDVAEEMSTFKDLGADSLDIVEITMNLEEKFGISIHDDKLETVKNLGDVIDLIQEELNNKSEEC